MRLSERIKGYRAARAKLEEFRAKDCAVTYAGAEGWTAQYERRAKLTAAIDRVICTLSYLYQKRDALQAAQRLMVQEQGLTACDLPWCHRAATHKWTRTAAELKSMLRKHKGAWLVGESESIRCQCTCPRGVWSPTSRSWAARPSRRRVKPCAPT